MKRNIRKNILYLILAVAFLCCFFAGCKQSKENDVERIENQMTLNESSLDLKVGDKTQIVAFIELEDGLSFVYSSSNVDVVSVDENGKIEALKEGSAVISVTYGESNASCNVAVSLKGELPVIKTQSVQENAVIKIPIDGKLDLLPTIFFNGKEFNDGSFEYIILDGSVAVCENNVIKPLKYGETEIQVQATWRGIKEVTLRRIFTLQVIGQVELSVNGGKGSVIDVYTRSEFGGNTYNNSSNFVVTATEKQPTSTVNLDYTYSVISGESLVVIDKLNGKITATGKSGRSVVRISCKDSKNVEYQTDVTVNILTPVAECNETFEFSAVDGVLPLDRIFGESVAIEKAICNGNELNVEDNAKILGVPTIKTGANELTLEVFTDEVGYRVPIKAYEKIILKPQDLEYFQLNNTDDETINKVFDGYYVLGKNIDCSGYVLGSVGFISTGKVSSFASVGLRGTFDGRGYTIKNLTFGRTDKDFNRFDEQKRKEYNYSLFGVIGNGGEVKNLGISNLKFDVPNEVTKGTVTTFATQIMGGKITNCYVQLDGLNFNSAGWRSSVGLFNRIDNVSTLNNIVLSVKDDGTVDSFLNNVLISRENSSVFGSMFGNIRVSQDKDGNDIFIDNETLSKKWQNVYVVSNTVLSRDCTDRLIFDAENIENSSVRQSIAGVKRFLTEKELADYSVNVPSLNGEMWKVVNDTLMFNSVEIINDSNVEIVFDSQKTAFTPKDKKAIFGDENAEIEDISVYSEDFSVTIENGNVTFLKENVSPLYKGEICEVALKKVGENDWTKINIRLVTEIISTFEQLETTLCLNQIDYGNALVTENKKIDGYYVLGNSIDGTGKTFKSQGYIANLGDYQTSKNNRNEGFVGTFDGKGYTISNITFDSGNPSGTRGETNGYNNMSLSLFGFIGKDAVVKNFAMTNIKYRIHKSSDNQPINYANCAALAYYVMGSATIENVYLDTYGIVEGGHIDYTSLSGLATRIHDGVTMNNVVVKMILGNDISLDVKTTGSICALYTGDGTIFNLTKNLTNTYVISNKGLGNISGTTARFDASNLGTEAIQQCTCIIRYLDETAYTSEDLLKFNGNDFWTTESNKVVWKQK